MTAGHMSVSAWLGVPETDKENYALRMAVHILGVGSESRLFKTIREEMGLAYLIGSRYEGAHRGYFEIIGRIHPNNVQKAIDASFAEMTELRKKKVDTNDLDIAKANVLRGIFREGENIELMLHLIDKNLSLRGSWPGEEPYTTREYANGILDVTANDIIEVTNKYFPKSRKHGKKHIILIRDPLLQK